MSVAATMGALGPRLEGSVLVTNAAMPTAVMLGTAVVMEVAVLAAGTEAVVTRRMTSIRMVLVLGFGAAACSSPFDPHEARLLAAARAQWEQRPFGDYTFEARHGCFCLPEQVGPVRITVRQGAIVSVSLLENGEPVDPAHWFTIEQLYERIPSWAEYDGVEDVSVEYDPTLGFPSRIVVQANEGIADAGDTYTVSNVGPA